MLRALGCLLTVLILLVAAGIGGVLYTVARLDEPGPLAQETTVEIAAGTGPRKLAPLLEEKGVVGDGWLFLIALYAQQAQAEIKAGEYAFQPHMSLNEVVAHLRDGRPVPHYVTVPEGLTVSQIVTILNNEPLLEGDVGPLPAEGDVLPDTYQFVRGSKRSEVLARMVQAHRELMADLWPLRDKDIPVRTAQEAVTLASIVEKETGIPSERAEVASVFVNRLRADIRLQSDPTVIYGLSGRTGVLGRELTRADWKDESPYNTYVIKGLPPGPIANPGRAAIDAVLHPARTDWLYFVADGSGGHVFSRTLAEHNRNVAKWQDLRDGQAPAGGGAAHAPLAAPPVVQPDPSTTVVRPRME